MFKKLRERIAEETTRFPVGQRNNNVARLPDSETKLNPNSTEEDLITLSDSSSVVVPLTSPQQFSIDDEEGVLSDPSTPQKRPDISSTSEVYYTPNASMRDKYSDVKVFQEYHPSKAIPFVPQSDIESEREEPPTLNLDEVSKDHLLSVIQSLKARSYKYKNKYSEIVKNYKDLRDEKVKVENTLIENQDRGLRRLAELREQCLLEQKAKAHLEENLRLMLEEKDSRISVLETQINLLKDGSKLNENHDTSVADSDSKNSDGSEGKKLSVHQEKIERLEHVLLQSKNTIVSQKEQITLLRKQNESLLNELEEKVKSLNETEDKQKLQKSKHEEKIHGMQIRLDELVKQQEESIMAMAETKKNMHAELELKEKQLKKAEDEARQYKDAVEHERAVVAEIRRQHEEKVNQLQNQSTTMETTLEDEKKSLIQELTRGKSAAINLMQQECSRKIASMEEEWRVKLQQLQLTYESSNKSKEENVLQGESNSLQLELTKMQSTVDELQKENTSLKKTIENLRAEMLESQKKESLKTAEDKFQMAEQNYRTELDETKSKVTQFEKEKSILENKHSENVKSIQNKFEAKLKDCETRLKSKDEELKFLQGKYELCNKEISSFRENVKDSENTIVKLKNRVSALERDNSEKIDELSKRVKQLELEREQLMIQAQERVSATESKCREDIKLLHEKNNQLLSENKEIENLKSQIELLNTQLDESLIVAEANQTAASQEIQSLKLQLSEACDKFGEIKSTSSCKELELLDKIKILENQNTSLLQDKDDLELLKVEREQLSEKLQNVTTRLEDVEQLESKIEEKEQEIEKLKDGANSYESEKKLLACEIDDLKKRVLELNTGFEAMKSKQNDVNSDTIKSLQTENESLVKKICVLEQFDSSDPNNAAVKQYVSVIKGECEAKMKAKESEMDNKMNRLIRDFCVQMNVKDKDCDEMVAEMLEKSQDLEDKLYKESQVELSALRQDLFEKDCALEEMHDHYEELLQEKDAKFKELESSVKHLRNSGETDSANQVAEGSDWDDTWAVPEETCEPPSLEPNSKECDEHVQQIETLQEELLNCQSEVKELKILLRLSPPQSLVSNNNFGCANQSIPEPTEIEYLKNIIFEYMMGKEPITLVKVIAAVLRFSDTQTQQVLRKEESRHQTR